jgi:hypothetical protein
MRQNTRKKYADYDSLGTGENVRKGVSNRVNGSNAIIKNLFWGALSLKSFLLSYHIPEPESWIASSFVRFVRQRVVD